jgi:hypothetical protein
MAKRKRKRREWTDAEITFLRQNYGPLSTKQIAIRLDRPEISVHKKIKALNIQKYSGLIKPKICFEDVLAGWIPGDRVRVILPELKGNKKVIRHGRVVEVHEQFILVQLREGWRECVNVGTIIAGEAQIELLERGKVA